MSNAKKIVLSAAIILSTAFSTLTVAALGFAVLATPALAQPTRHHQLQQDYGATQSSPATQYPALNEQYPNGAVKSGSEENVESGAAFNQGS
jgi:hypothetical protein